MAVWGPPLANGSLSATTTLAGDVRCAEMMEDKTSIINVLPTSSVSHFLSSEQGHTYIRSGNRPTAFSW